MPYTISNLRVRNFKCFDSKKFYEFHFHENRNPAILSGPNGFGKTTFFDAIELIFTKKITRLQTNIENGRLNLGKNILLNEADKKGNLVLTIVDENKTPITIVVVIDNLVQKLIINNSIKYSVIDGILASDEEIDRFLCENGQWKDSLKDFEKLKYSMEHFNVYYYVSQAESVHFLKNSITNRKDSMNALLNTEIIEEDIKYITDKLIGGNLSRRNVLINDAISVCDENITKKANLLKTKLENAHSSVQNVEYSQLLEYPMNAETLNWDIEKPLFGDGGGLDLRSITFEIKSLHNYVVNLNDYNAYMQNEKINSLINNKAVINDVLDFYAFLDNGFINKDKIKNIVNKWNEVIEVYNNSAFFRKKLELKSFKKEHLYKLNGIRAGLVSVNIEEVSNMVNLINEVEKNLSNKQSMLTELDNARTRLHEIKNSCDNDSPNCPYCNQRYKDVDELENAFTSFSKSLKEEKSEESQKIQSMTEALQKLLKSDLDAVASILQGYDEQKIQDLNVWITKYNQFLNNKKRIDDLEAIYPYLKNSDSWANLDRDEKSIEIIRVLQKQQKDYNNLNFLNDMATYNFESISEKYKKVLSITQPRIAEKDNVDKKIQYLQYQSSISTSTEIQTLKGEIKDEMLKKMKLNNIRGRFDDLQKIYQNSINDYKNQILKKLRVPLLIYTGKILQDYQNGLGVFVSKDEMRFVSNGDAKHDILNTFSSGQLSGFVLAFLFSMNKQYIMKSSDDIGFILVDDPVQTMDDINISSFIEVLRNDFSDKQIIISTHESDKENYILYKFLKYNLKGQSFNVKEKIYI